MLSRWQILKRKLSVKYFGKEFCTLENRSGHAFEIYDRVEFMLMCKCSKCDMLATYDPITGLCT